MGAGDSAQLIPPATPVREHRRGESDRQMRGVRPGTCKDPHGLRNPFDRSDPGPRPNDTPSCRGRRASKVDYYEATIVVTLNTARCGTSSELRVSSLRGGHRCHWPTFASRGDGGQNRVFAKIAAPKHGPARCTQGGRPCAMGALGSLSRKGVGMSGPSGTVGGAAGEGDPESIVQWIIGDVRTERC